MERVSLFKLSGLPDTFCALLASVSLILMLIPYFAGADFGLFKIPEVTASIKKVLRIAGPAILLIVILLFIPVAVPKVSLNGQFIVVQENDASVIFQLTQNGNKVTGTARYYNGKEFITGAASGTVSSDNRNVDLTVNWSSTSRGQYTWNIGPKCRLVSGQAIDLNKTNSSTNLRSESSFCQ